MKTVEDNLSDLLEKVKQLATELEASLERVWIPVTERLPEEEGWYLVTRMWANEKTPKIVTEWWFADTKNWATMGKVLAWMELPKPYEEGGETDGVGN